QTLITEGLEKNVDLKIAYTRITQAEANFKIAKAAVLPSLSAVGQVNHTRTTGEGNTALENSTTVRTLGLSASWELNLWGKQTDLSRAKYASYLNSYAYRNLIQTALVAKIANGYYNLMALDEQLRITKATEILLTQSAETMQALKNAGQQNQAAVEQSNALLYSTQLMIPVLESKIRQQENAICTMLGRRPGAVARSVMNKPIVPDKLYHGVPVQLLAKRPDVQQAELNFRSAYNLTKAAQASLYPTLTISPLSVGFIGGSDFFKPANLAANVVGGITQPLFMKRQLRGNIKIAKAQQEEALLNFQNTVTIAGQEVSDILYSYHMSVEKDSFRIKQIEALTKAVDYTEELLMAGEATYTEVLLAQQNLLTVQLNQINDWLEQYNYSVNLYKALGGGVK
nr:TolC family protein [Breznakibacter sp.]